MGSNLLEYLKINELTEERFIGMVRLTPSGDLIMYVLMSKKSQKVIMNDNGKRFAIRLLGDYFVPKTYYEFSIRIKSDPLTHREILKIDQEQNFPLQIEKPIENKEFKVSHFVIGEKYTGTINKITEFGLLVKVDDVIGLVYKDNISHTNQVNEKDKYAIGQIIEVVLLEIDEHQQKINFGIKQLSPHPWQLLAPEISIGKIITGKITNIADYGLFVEVQEGVMGLVHITELTWRNISYSIRKLYTINEVVSAKIIDLDRSAHKMNLSIRLQYNDPWQDFDQKYKVGDIVNGKVVHLASYGILIEIDPEVFGMIHISEIGYNCNYQHANEYTAKGEIITCKIVLLDINERKIGLSIKALEEDPWPEFEKLFPIESVHEGVIIKINSKGATVKIGNSMIGFAHTKYMKTADSNDLGVNDKAMFKILTFEGERNMAKLSHWHTWK